MPRTSATRVSCPQSGHAGSRVKLDGTYGRPGHRRQRYKCLPSGGGKPHVFTELLPREESWQDSCEQCERHVERREGPKAPRHYQFVARGIAEGLAPPKPFWDHSQPPPRPRRRDDEQDHRARGGGRRYGNARRPSAVLRIVTWSRRLAVKIPNPYGSMVACCRQPLTAS